MGQDLGIISCKRVCLIGWKFLLSVAVNVVCKPAMMGGMSCITHMEGVLLVVSGYGCSRQDRLVSAAEGMSGVDKMSMVHVKS